MLLFTVLCTTLTALLLQIIRRPVDIAKIQQRIDDEKYDDMNAMQKVGAVKTLLRQPLNK